MLLLDYLLQLFSRVGVILFGATCVVIIVLSLVTRAIPKEELAGLTWATIRHKKQTKHVKSRANGADDNCMFYSLFIKSLRRNCHKDFLYSIILTGWVEISP